MESKKIYRSRSNAMISGVCSGFAEYFGMDPTVVRLLYVALSLFTVFFPGLLFYIAAALIIPLEN